MTRDELTRLSFNDLVDLILRLQSEVAHLQVRVAELEMQTSQAAAAPAPDAELHWTSAPSSAPSSHPAQAPVLTARAIEEHVHGRRSRHHRPWYRKLWRAMMPQNPRLSLTVIIAVLIVLALSITAVYWIPSLQDLTLIRRAR